MLENHRLEYLVPLMEVYDRWKLFFEVKGGIQLLGAGTSLMVGIKMIIVPQVSMDQIDISTYKVV